MSSLYLDACVRSDVGTVRGNNEDNYNLCGQYREDVDENDSRKECRVRDEEALFSVCDGMGGEAHGEIASLVAVSNMKSLKSSEFDTAVNEQVLQLNRLVCEEVNKRGHISMGSTLSNLYIDKGQAQACNLGDSRTYMLRDGELKKLSVDHDEATHLVRLGLLSEEDARTDVRRHQLTQYLGMPEEEFIPEPYLSERISIRPGDRFMICSDGVTDVLSDQEIKDILAVKNRPGEACNDLIYTALLKKSKDNCTALVVDVKRKPLFLRLGGK